MSSSIAGNPGVSPEAARTFSERRGWWLYQTIRLILRPLRRWARLQAKGLELLPESGGALIVSNHDSWLDPLAMIEVMMWRKRQLRFLAKHTLWRSRLLAWVLDRTGQIPIRRGEGDVGALEAVTDAVGRGETIGIFPEGTFSRGKNLRARRGISRLAGACPDVPIVLVAVTGGTDLKRFPKRPRVTVEFFEPATGLPDPTTDSRGFAQSLLDQIRARAPRSA